MPSFTYTDAPPKSFELWPNGDYLGEVIAAEFSLSRGGKTRGSDILELTIKFTRDKNGAPDSKEVTERLIFHPSTQWKIDQFCKSYNLLIDGKPLEKGQNIDMSTDQWIRAVVGLRGWASLGHDEYEVEKNGVKEKRKKNIVAVFITNKEKLTKVIDLPTTEELGPDGEPLPF